CPARGPTPWRSPANASGAAGGGGAAGARPTPGSGTSPRPPSRWKSAARRRSREDQPQAGPEAAPQASPEDQAGRVGETEAIPAAEPETVPDAGYGGPGGEPEDACGSGEGPSSPQPPVRHRGSRRRRPRLPVRGRDVLPPRRRVREGRRRP